MRVIKEIQWAGLIAGFALSSIAQAASANATPLGIEVGVASCEVARAKLGRVTEKAIGRDVLLEAKSPEEVYPGASQVVARCSERDRVIAVLIEASKGGMGNEASRQAYATLASKYKRVAGGPMPSLGDGYARFVAGSTVVEQSAPHLSFQFSVVYYDKAFYDLLQAKNEEQRKTTQKKASSL